MTGAFDVAEADGVIWLGWGNALTATFYAGRLDTATWTIDDSTELVPSPIRALSWNPIVRATSSAVTLTFTWLDPIRGVPRLAVVPIAE